MDSREFRGQSAISMRISRSLILLGFLTLCAPVTFAWYPLAADLDAAPSRERQTESRTAAGDPERGLALMKAAATAMGGIDALNAIESVRLKGDVVLKGPTGEMKGDSVAELLYPDRIRSVVNVPMGQLVQVFDGEHGWVQMGGQTQELPEAMITEMRRSIVTSGGIGLVRTAANGEAEALAVGSEEIEGRPADVVLWKMDGQEVRVLLDAETHLISGIAFQATTPEGPGTIEVIFDDYRATDGVRVPWKVTGFQNGDQYLSIQATAFTVNPKLDRSAFTKP